LSSLYTDVILSFSFLFSSFFACNQVNNSGKNVHQADIIVYGGTSAAVTAAVQAKKMGKSVIMVSPDVTFRRTFFRWVRLHRYR
jgi:thioredoxin reductase